MVWTGHLAREVNVPVVKLSTYMHIFNVILKENEKDTEWGKSWRFAIEVHLIVACWNVVFFFLEGHMAQRQSNLQSSNTERSTVTDSLPSYSL